MSMNRGWLSTLVILCATVSSYAATDGRMIPIGVAKLEITPELPIRLAGYQNRPGEADRVMTPLFARALAIGSDTDNPAVLIAVELIGIGAESTEFVAAALGKSHGIQRARVAICATHVHSGPALADVLPFMFSKEIPADEDERIRRYTEGLRLKLVQVAQAALADRKPARLAWAQGAVDFAVQRRVVVDGQWKNFGVVPEGPVDHALPLLCARDEKGAVRALFLNYACHCTSLLSADNFVHSDWAGDAATRIETGHRGAIALVALGCGADANPNPRGLAAVTGHGEKIAKEVARLLAGPLRELGSVTQADHRRIELDLDHGVTREELQPKVAPGSRQQVAFAAGKYLQRLESGQTLPTTVPFDLQTWSFGTELSMVFLAGEVVSEYALRLRRELDGQRLWVNGYANSMPCYIPSKRMFPEGGYEVDASMDYYGWPTRLARGTEDHIIKNVRELVPTTFHRKP